MSRRPRLAVSTAWILTLAAAASCDAPAPARSATDQPVTADTWFFRGTPNNWGTTAMTAAAATSFTTCQTFANVANPRFKIDHHGDWAETYPAQDFAVANGSY